MTTSRGFRAVWIIFNPNSTGNSKKRALAFARSLKKRGIRATCVPTEYAGHAEVLAKELAETHKSCAIISSSGDGGYNEVINGVLLSSSPKVTCGVLPAGNANDHYHALHRGKTTDRIQRVDVDAIDCIEVKYGNKTRYAHSYIGLGLSPQIGQELTRRKLTPSIEAWVVATKLFRITPVKITHNGSTRLYDHLVISNIPKMSKFITVAPGANVTDGLLEITTVKSGSFLRLLRHLLRRVVAENAEPKQISDFDFTCVRPAILQLDGEVVQLKQGQRVRVSCAPKLLRTIV